MSSTFGSLNIAKTGLQYQQIAIDTANNNIANVNTDGYVRRRAVAAEMGGPGQPVMWSSSDGHGQGVATQSVQRLTDILLDKRVRTEHANLSYLQVQQTSLERVEASVDEPSDNGVAAAIANFSAAWQNVVSAPDGTAARQSVIASGQTLAAAIKTQADAVDSEEDEQRAGALQDVTDINQDAQQLAQLNHNIYVAQADGSDVGDLEDQRDQLAMDLANKAGATTTVDPATGMYNVTLDNGSGSPVSLVAGANAGTIVVAGIAADGTTTAAADAAGTVSFTVTDPVPYGTTASTNATAVTPGGDLGGVQVLLNVTLPNYRASLNKLASDLAGVVNAQHESGYTQDGSTGGAFFSFDPADAAGSLAVSITDPTKIAASKSGGDNDSTNADRIGQVILGAAPVDAAGQPLSTDPLTNAPVGAVNVSDEYQRLISGLGATAAGLNTQVTNQQLLTTQVDDEREQTAGVSLDEETINLMEAQRAYEASSRVLSVMNSILDTLINHTGA